MRFRVEAKDAAGAMQPIEMFVEAASAEEVEARVAGMLLVATKIETLPPIEYARIAPEITDARPAAKERNAARASRYPNAADTVAILVLIGFVAIATWLLMRAVGVCGFTVVLLLLFLVLGRR